MPVVIFFVLLSTIGFIYFTIRILIIKKRLELADKEVRQILLGQLDKSIIGLLIYTSMLGFTIFVLAFWVR